MNKICTVCNVEKPIKDFGPRFKKPHARSSCRVCEAAYQREYKHRNLEKCRKAGRENAARERANPKTRARVLMRQKKAWRNGGAERYKAYLNRLKETNFFKWKARKSYVWLTEEELKSLWEAQSGLCALTGRPLDTSAELDHIVPKTRGGKDTPDNAQWLCGAANQAKRNMLDDEFVAFCREVVAWADR